jgi:cell division protein FtsB
VIKLLLKKLDDKITTLNSLVSWVKKNPQILIIALLLGGMIFQHLFLSNSYKKEYYKLLKEQEEKYEQQIDKLHTSNDSILALNVRIKDRIAEIDRDIAKKEAELAKLKKQNAQNTAKLNAMSDTELSSTFTELFN